jgi:hypothetical protein
MARFQQRSASFSHPECNDLTDLGLPLKTGDVICVKGNADRITRLGATGGFMGHVLLVLADPVGVHQNSAEANEYLNIWPRKASTVWIVKTGESRRDAEGFNETDVLLYVNARGQIIVFGEVADDSLDQYEMHTQAQLFCCPPDLREQCFEKDMDKILAQMRKGKASWSWGTAVRAFLLSADVSDSADLEKIKRCWKADPICTSVVIIFWQKYMCKLADSLPDSDAMEWILAWMPLMADRALPGELMSTMQRCGWTVMDSIQEGRQRSHSCPETTV